MNHTTDGRLSSRELDLLRTWEIGLRWPEPVRDEVLGRLLDLNAKRYAEEQLAR